LPDVFYYFIPARIPIMRIFFVPLLLISLFSYSQSKPASISNSVNNSIPDSAIRERLIVLAMSNPAITEANAMVNSAQYELKRAKTSWLNTVSVSGNINELVVNNTTINGMPASTLFPKYNVGVNLPLGMFSKQEKNISKEKVKVFEAQKEGKTRAIRKEVLIRYENYKEKKELFELQKQMTDGQYSNYQQKQKEYASREISKLEEVNKEFELWVEQRSKQRTKEKELKVAELELEELIGMSITDAIRSVITNN
jgi:outer membrane protein TolC